MRSLRDRVGADRLGNARSGALEHRRSRLGRHVTRPDAGAAGQNHPALARELLDRLGNRSPLVGNDSPDDLEPLAGEQLLERVTALVLARAHVHAVGDR